MIEMARFRARLWLFLAILSFASACGARNIPFASLAAQAARGFVPDHKSKTLPNVLAKVYVADIVGTQGGAHGKPFGTNAVFKVGPNVSVTKPVWLACVTGTPTHQPVQTPTPGTMYRPRVKATSSPVPTPSPARGCSGTLFAEPRGLARDANGNLYVADSGAVNGEPVPPLPYAGPGIYEVPAGPSPTPTLLIQQQITGLVPTGVAVDGATPPNLYFTAVAAGVTIGVYEYSLGSKTLTTIATESSGTPGHVAVDRACTSQCTVYVANYGNGTVYKFTPPTAAPSPMPSSSPTPSPGPTPTWKQTVYRSGLNDPYGIAVHNGNVYVSLVADSAVVLMPPHGKPMTCVTGGTPKPSASGDKSTCPAETVHKQHGIAVDANGNVFIADSNHGAIKLVQGSTVYCIAPASPPKDWNCDGNHFTGGGAGFFHPNAVVPYRPYPVPSPTSSPTPSPTPSG